MEGNVTRDKTEDDRSLVTNPGNQGAVFIRSPVGSVLICPSLSPLVSHPPRFGSVP